MSVRTWKELNALVKDADRRTCRQLLDDEKNGKRRKQFLLRIHSRLNKVRADEERAELMELAK